MLQALWLPLILAPLFLLIRLSVRKRGPLPPGPPRKPLIGNLLDMSFDNPLAVFETWRKRYGNVVYLEVLGNSIVVKLTLQECAILAFDLMNNPDITLTRFARVDVQMEPRDINDLENILLGTGPTPEKIQGVLQITGFQPNDPIPVEEEELERTQEIWHFARALAADRGHPHEHVVVLDVSYACGPVAIQVPMVIYPQLKKRPPTGTVEEKLENLNLQIRVDPNNEMGALRSEMQPADIRIMREVATFTERGPPWMMFAKIATEKVYADIYQRLGQDD